MPQFQTCFLHMLEYMLPAKVSYKCHKHMCRKHISCNQLSSTAVVLLCTGISHKEPRTEEVKLEVHIHVSSFTALLALDTSLLTFLISFGTCCTTIGKDQLWRAWEQACMFGDHNMNVHLLSEVQVFLWLVDMQLSVDVGKELASFPCTKAWERGYIEYNNVRKWG